ncbi:uncharacterized protein MELLADRAFT_65713 [Melampsora larici-populina 98AG31]|uniref:Uncharacterized protein n=1 Tax=Melampsora larici-populina (strain 98AG31 / pathotype 3-4-7) TaxID=747676 RepID=F4RWG0_MELLP|nr:uncharacterized protein MELLADRAFT_65713 [Melampsora larici-populina 98AG31]EGG03276.1 hypothetical protein MELLADRAFT_65713 [Melampsora larici-populina 98AG31]
MSSSYQKIKSPIKSSASSSTSYLNFQEDQEFKKVQKHLESLGLRESIRRKSIRNHSSNLQPQINLLDLKSIFTKRTSTRPSIPSDHHHPPRNQLVQSPIPIESEPEPDQQTKASSSLGIEFTDQEILTRSERVQSAFIEHCQWTTPSQAHPPCTTKPKPSTSLLSKVTEESNEVEFNRDLKIKLDWKISSTKHHRTSSSTDTILAAASSKYYPEPILPDDQSKSSKYFSGNSLDTLVSNTNQSVSSSKTSRSSFQQPLLNPQMKYKPFEKTSYQTDHRFDDLHEFDEFDEDPEDDDHVQYPTMNLNRSGTSHSNNQIRKISFFDWILCSCCISDEDLNDQFDQIGKTCPE